MKVDAYLIFSVLFISLLIMAIVVAAVFAESFQKRPINTCPDTIPCPDCPGPIPCTGATANNCIYNLINFPTTLSFYIMSSVYYTSGVPIGGFLTETNSGAVDGLIGITLSPTTTDLWDYDGTLLTSNASPTLKFYVFTGATGFFKSIFLGTAAPDAQWRRVTQFALSDGFVVLTVNTGTKYNLISYSPQGGSSIAIAGEILSGNATFPETSPFYTAQVWRTIV